MGNQKGNMLWQKRPSTQGRDQDIDEESKEEEFKNGVAIGKERSVEMRRRIGL